MKDGSPVKFEECPRYGTTFTGRMRACKCGKCRICGHPKHTAVHGGVMGHENENVVWGHEFKPSTIARATIAKATGG